LKQHPRIATGYEKRAISYAAVLTIAAILLWLWLDEGGVMAECRWTRWFRSRSRYRSRPSTASEAIDPAEEDGALTGSVIGHTAEAPR
jgi:hypothetical protein